MHVIQTESPNTLTKTSFQASSTNVRHRAAAGRKCKRKGRAAGEQSATCPLFCYLDICLNGGSKYYDRRPDWVYLLVTLWLICTEARWLMSQWHDCPETPRLSLPPVFFFINILHWNCYVSGRSNRSHLCAFVVADGGIKRRMCVKLGTSQICGILQSLLL